VGRHAAAGPVDEEPPDQPVESRWRVWAERAVLATVAAVGTLAAARWAGAGWSTAGWIAAGVLVVVPTAAWLSTTLPGGDRPEN
jgi:hypothetical protein